MTMTCAEMEGLTAELALGTVSGSERAVALDHLAGCAACRGVVDQLAHVADSLLLLAPATEPPPGFESKVLSKMHAAPTPITRPGHRRRRRALAGIAAAALVAALSGVGVARLDDGGRPSPAIRTALASDVAGHWTCRAVVYGDTPTWLVVSLDRTDGLNATFSVEAVHSGDPSPVPVGTFTIDQGHGTFARTVELPANDLQSVRVLDAGGRVRYVMTFTGPP